MNANELTTHQRRAIRNAMMMSGTMIPQTRYSSTMHALYRRGLVESSFVRGVGMPVLTEEGKAIRERLLEGE